MFVPSVTHPIGDFVREWVPRLAEYLPANIQSEDLNSVVAFLINAVICIIAVCVVNIYSIGYMREDRSAGRFFALLSLFSFSMLGLVVATNLFQMFIFWELVGVSSYLLIGFWYHKPSAVSASKQAFILTRFADSFFLL